MKATLLCLCACLGLFSCTKEDATPESISIRVRNASQYQFDDIVVITPGGENKYGKVGIGQSSEYKSFAQAYPYAYVKLTVQGQELVLQPIDYVGATLLEPGRHTYALDVVNGTQRRLTISLEKP